MKSLTVATAMLVLATASAASAHGGGLNAQGCHNDRRNGTYHCHRGNSPSPAPAPRRATPSPSPILRGSPEADPVAVDPLLSVPPSNIVPQTLAGRGPVVGRAVVLDGDTLQIGAQRIRLWGIDAFEAAQQCNGPDGRNACGAHATRELSELVSGREVICSYRDTDAYQRMVALCRVGSTDLGAHLVRRGLAIAFTRYSQDYVPDEAVARAERVGAWEGNFIPPTNYRAGETNSVAGAQRAPTSGNSSCLIKGNISRAGERIYHMPGDPFYGRTNAEAMFCSEEEAATAGFRRAGQAGN